MTVNTTRQYRPVSTSEVETDDGLSVRSINDLADSINNYADHAGAHKLRCQACIPHWESDDNTTEERVIHPFAAVEIPDGFDYITALIAHYRDGTADVTWRLYVDRYAYYGPESFDATKLSPDYESASFVSASTTPAIAVVTGIPVVRGDWGTFMILTAQNDTMTERAKVATIDIWPAR